MLTLTCVQMQATLVRVLCVRSGPVVMILVSSLGRRCSGHVFRSAIKQVQGKLYTVSQLSICFAFSMKCGLVK